MPNWRICFAQVVTLRRDRLKIAATTNQTGSILIDPNRPRMRLIGVRRGIYVGNVVDKIGSYGVDVQKCDRNVC